MKNKIKNRRLPLSLVLTAIVLTVLVILINLSSLSLFAPHIPPNAAFDNSGLSITPKSSETLLHSSFLVNTPNVFIYPPPTPIGLTEKYDPYKIIEQADKDQAKWIANEQDKPTVRLIHGSILPSIDTPIQLLSTASGYPYSAIWLKPNEPFKGVAEVWPFYPKEAGEPQTFIIKAFIDGKEIKLAQKGKLLDDKISLQLKIGERAFFEFETEPLPVGVHTLGILEFGFTDDNNPDQLYQNFLNILSSYPYKVFVGSGQSAPEPLWYDWSVGNNLFPKYINETKFVDLQQTLESLNSGQGKQKNTSSNPPGFVLWKPANIQVNQRVNYNIAFTNTDKGDQEHCLVAMLDYKVVPIQDDKIQLCGIVKAGQWGVISASFSAPATPGSHHFSVIQITNPLMKDSYLQGRPNEPPSRYKSIGRVLLNVQ